MLRLVGYILEYYYDARTHERQILNFHLLFRDHFPLPLKDFLAVFMYIPSLLKSC
jgi:hypothetical protein